MGDSRGQVSCFLQRCCFEVRQEVDSETFQTHYVGAGMVCSEVGSQCAGVRILWVVCVCILGFIFSFWLNGSLSGLAFTSSMRGGYLVVAMW